MSCCQCILVSPLKKNHHRNIITASTRYIFITFPQITSAQFSFIPSNASFWLGFFCPMLGGTAGITADRNEYKAFAVIVWGFLGLIIVRTRTHLWPVFVVSFYQRTVFNKFAVFQLRNYSHIFSNNLFYVLWELCRRTTFCTCIRPLFIVTANQPYLVVKP